MSRRAPPPEYYDEEDEYEIERERKRDPHPRSRRRDREYEDDVEYRRRRSMPPMEDFERLHIRERPPRDFMREDFGPRERDRVRMSRDELDENPPEDFYVRPRRRGHRPREVDEELIVDGSERRGSRKHRSREFDEELIVDEPERRGSRGSRRHRAPEIDEEDLILEERERRGSRRHRPREVDEEDLIIDDRKRRGGRKYRPPEDEIEEEDLILEERDRRGGRRYRPEKDLEEEDVMMRRKRRYPPRPYDSEGDLRLRETRFEDERDNMYIPPPRRSRRHEPDLDEVEIDERERDRPRSAKYREEPPPRPKEEVVMRWKDRPSSRELDDDDELQIRETHRRRRRSHPEPRYTREPPGAWPEETEDEDPELPPRPRVRSKPRRREVEEDEEVIIRKDRDGNRRRRSAESDRVMMHKEKRKSPPPRERSPSMDSVHAPPIHQDVISHHRHIDHGFDRPPRAPSPEISSTRTSIDEGDVNHRSAKSNHNPQDDAGSGDQSDDESVSPTSGPSVDFHNPWKCGKTSSRHKPSSLADERDSSIAASSHNRSHRDLGDIDIEEKRSQHTKRSQPRSLVDDSPKDAKDDWSVVHAPSKAEAMEMSGALDIVEVAPKHSSEPEIEVEEDESEVASPKGKESKDHRDERWTEITKDLVVREAIERLGYEFEETRMFYYIFSYLESADIDELVDLSDEIRQARRRRIREMQRERASIPPRPASLMDRIPPRPRMPERRMREREWLLDGRR